MFICPVQIFSSHRFQSGSDGSREHKWWIDYFRFIEQIISKKMFVKECLCKKYKQRMKMSTYHQLFKLYFWIGKQSPKFSSPTMNVIINDKMWYNSDNHVKHHTLQARVVYLSVAALTEVSASREPKSTILLTTSVNTNTIRKWQIGRLVCTYGIRRCFWIGGKNSFKIFD